VKVVYAANHSELAVQVHRANHPHTIHECQDLHQADFSRLPRHDLVLASPACQGHSQCSQPKRRDYHDAMRSTAWAVVSCVDVTEPRAFIVENVLDFKRWRLYPEWSAALRRIGYHLTELVVDGERHGVPQKRRRLFVVGLRNQRTVRVRPSDTVTPFGPCIDWHAPVKWRHVDAASPGAQVRIRASRRLGPQALVQHVTGHRGIGLDEPIRTITTKDQWIIVDGDRYRSLTVREYARAMDFRDDYMLPDVSRSTVVRGLGNAVPPGMEQAVVEATLEVA
jgi:DNA (cytosine-5)-methyltransferase 1